MQQATTRLATAVLVLASFAMAGAQSHAYYANDLIEEVWGEIISCDANPVIANSFDFDFPQVACGHIDDTSTNVNKRWISERASELGLENLSDGWSYRGIYASDNIDTWLLLLGTNTRRILVALFVVQDGGGTLMLVGQLPDD